MDDAYSIQHSISTALFLSLFFVSCLSYPKGTEIDTTSSDESKLFAEPMLFEPSADPLFFRFDLIRGRKEVFLGETSDTALVDVGYAVFGCYLGNGLTVDANGNVYLDPYKYFDIDPRSDFSIKYGPETIKHSADEYRIRGFRDGTLQDESAVTTESGEIKVKSGFSATRNLKLGADGKSGTCVRGFEIDKMAASDRGIRVSGTSAGVRSFKKDGEAVKFNGEKRITIEQRGNHYSIKVTDMFFIIPKATVSYDLSYQENRLIIKKENRVFMDNNKRPEGLFTQSGKPVFEIMPD
jgi:hypothetical protein